MELRIADYQNIPRSRRRLFYRYGPIVFDPQFDFALELFREADPASRMSEYGEGAWTGDVGHIREILEKIRHREEHSFDEGRLIFQEAYEEFIREKRRPPTQAELFQRRWKLSAMPSVRTHRSHWTGELLREKLDAIYAGDLIDEKLPKVPEDKNTRSYRDKTETMGLVLLDGHKLRRYEALYLELKKAGDGNESHGMMPAFVVQSLRRFPPAFTSVRDLPFPEFVEVFAAPFSLVPENRWVQGEELFQRIVDQALDRRSLNPAQHERVMLLYRLMIGFGRDLEGFIDGLPPSSNTGLPARWEFERKAIFCRTVAKLGRLPDFCSMWLENPEWTEFIDRSGEDVGSMAHMFRDLAIAYQRLRQSSETPTLGQVAEELPVVGDLAALVEPEILSREAIVYFCSLDMERS